MFSTKIAWEVAVTNGTALSEDVKVVNVDVKNIFDPSELLVAIVHSDTWAGGAEESSSYQFGNAIEKRSKISKTVFAGFTNTIR